MNILNLRDPQSCESEQLICHDIDSYDDNDSETEAITIICHNHNYGWFNSDEVP